ncbi:MAG: putative Ig domain-containing protein [Rhizobium sp.]|nr:putative Ig domain-containing protein [Rhizobium sp.]
MPPRKRRSVFQFAANTFSDIDVGNTLTYSAQLAGGAALPGWLSFDATTRTFSGTPDNDDVGTVSIDVIADDGNGGTVTDTFDIVVANTNDAPTVANAIADQSATKDAAFSFQFAANTFRDIDVGDTLTYSAQLAGGGALPGWLSFDAVTRTFSGTPANGNVGTVAVDVIADDGNGGTVTDTFDIVVANANDAPGVANAIANQSATEDAAFSFQFAANVFGDIDAGDTLTYSAQLAGGGALPAWLSFDAATRTLSGTPGNDGVGVLSIDVIANDGNGGTATDTFDITVANINDDPELTNPIGGQTANTGVAFSFAVPANTFVDIDIGDTLTYTALLADGSPLPDWLSFDAAALSLSGTPAAENVGVLSLRLTADDGNGGQAIHDFTLTVAVNTVANTAPSAVKSVAGQTAREGAAYALQLAADMFVDADAGDQLTYSARLADGGTLPAWLAFDAATHQFSGTPRHDDSGELAIQIVATDQSGATASVGFTLTIAEGYGGPETTGGTVRLDQGGVHTFQLADFGISNPDGLGAILIQDLPGIGKLRLDGTPVTAGTEIDIGDLSRLTWQPKGEGTGDSYASFSFLLIDEDGDRAEEPGTIFFDVSEVANRFAGGAGRQTLRGTSGDDIIIGGRGRDILIGGSGSDTFIFRTGDGRDVIRDFDARGAIHDVLDLTGFKSISGFADLMKNHVYVVGAGVEIDGGGGDIILLQGVKLKHLDAGDFLF